MNWEKSMNLWSGIQKKDKENHKESWGHSVGAHVKLKHNY